MQVKGMNRRKDGTILVRTWEFLDLKIAVRASDAYNQAIIKQDALILQSVISVRKPDI